jgi:protein-ribulosamine 3-kinase
MADRDALLRAALTRHLGQDPGPLQLSSVGGGSINTACVVHAGGASWFAKWNERPLPRQFEAEAAGLDAMRAAGSGLVIPEVIAFDDTPGQAFLLIEHLRPGRRVADFDDHLGRGLAALHRTTHTQGFGFALDGYCGATPQPNPWTASWSDFYVEHRLHHQIGLAARRGAGRREVQLLEAAAERARTLIDDDEPPALLHGDLWSGNLHVAPDGTPSLIDPAAYFGHREAELGMMALFGGFTQRVWDVYDEARPLRDGWRERLDLYTLYHVLNHYALFGGGYLSQAVALARRYA